MVGNKTAGRPLKTILLWAIILVAANVILFRYYMRLDLTADKRYTLSGTTRSLLAQLDQPLVVTVFLDGDLSTDIKRLQVAAKDLLDEYRARSGGKLQVTFVDPLAEVSGEAAEKVYTDLMEAGLEATNLNIRRSEGVLQKISFPGALVSYKGKQLPVNFLGTHFQTRSSAESIHYATENLEHQFTSVIEKLLNRERVKIGFLTGHGELSGRRIVDITGTLNQTYEVKQIELREEPLSNLNEYATLILAKPRDSFSEDEKYKLDQYLMQGGNLLIFADQFNASLDSMRTAGNMLALPLDLKLDDLFFKYGFRINYDLLRDMNCAPIPVVLETGGQGNQQLMPWVYFPLVFSRSQHPLVRHIDPVRMEFVSSIDTIATEGIRKTILLSTSPYTQKAKGPVYLSLDAIHDAADPAAFNAGETPVAVLLEGEFTSAFQHRGRARFDQSVPFLEKGKTARIIVVADGDVPANDISAIDNSYFPLGFDKYTRQTFGNKTFVSNCVDYLSGRSAILELRRREMGMRMLDRARAAAEGTRWKLINMIFPVALVLLFSFVYNLLRRQKYGRS